MPPSSDPPRRFPETSWGLVGRAGEPLTPEGRRALATLCELYTARGPARQARASLRRAYIGRTPVTLHASEHRSTQV